MNAPPRMIAVDFDGTICDFAFPEIGPVKAGVKEALTKFQALGFKVVIYSCRTSSWFADIFGSGDAMTRPRVVDMKEYLVKHKIPFDMIDDGSKGKPMCDYYIDDKGIRFQNNWAEISSFIESEN